MQNNFLSVLDCRDELVRVMHEQNSILTYMRENNLIPKYDTEVPLVIDSKNLPEMQKVLEGEAHKLQNFDVVISVVGTMKSGKSTTINAIIGKKVLPSRNRPMTTLPTLICHEKGKTVPTLKLNPQKIDELIQSIRGIFKEYPEILTNSEIMTLQSESELDVIRRIQSGEKFKSEINGSDHIFQELEYLNDIARILGVLEKRSFIEAKVIKEFYDSYREVNSLPTIFVEFESLKGIESDSEGRLMLLDTPGPNEVDQPQLQKILEQQLKRSSAVLLVLDYTQLKSEAEHNVRAQIDNIPTIQQDRLYVVVNKFDQQNSDSDGREKTINIVLNDLLKGKVKEEYIFPISAQNAFLAQRMIRHYDNTPNKPNVLDGWVQDYFSRDSGMADMVLALEASKVKEHANSRLKGSGISQLLGEVVNKAFVNAPQIAINSAITNSRRIFEDLSNVFSIGGYFLTRIQLNEEELEKVEAAVKQLEDSQKKLEESREEAQEEIRKLANNVGETILKELDALSQNITAEIERFGREHFNKKAERLKELKKKLSLFSFLFEEPSEAATRKQLRQELVALRAINENNNSVKEIRFASEDEKKEYEKHAESFYQDLIDESNQAGNKLIQLGVKNVKDKLKIFEELYIKKVNDIKGSFSSIDIELDITIPSLSDVLNVQLNDALELKQLQLSTRKTRIVEREGFWGSLFRAVDFFDADWGKDEETYFLYDNATLIDLLKENFRSEIISPLKSQSEQSIEVYGKKLITLYAKKIEEQTQSLINELKAAIINEQKPVEDLKEQKEHLTIAMQRNNSMKGAMKEIERAKELLFPNNNSNDQV